MTGRKRSHRLRARLPLLTERTVRALCASYRRRRHRGAYRCERELAPDDEERIEDALAETCEVGLREAILSDIAERRGAKYTQAVWIGESGYKERKRAAKRAIAERFGLPTE